MFPITEGWCPLPDLYAAKLLLFKYKCNNPDAESGCERESEKFSAKQKPTASGGGNVQLAMPVIPMIDSGFRVKHEITCFFFSKAVIFDGGRSQNYSRAKPYRRGLAEIAVVFNITFVARGDGHLTPKITICQKIWDINQYGVRHLPKLEAY